MTQMNVTQKQAAVIQSVEATTVQEIYQRLGGLADKKVSVTFDESGELIRLTFSDGSKIDLGASAHMSVLKAVSQASGTFLVYAPNPGVAANGGPPLPDMLCPCGGP